MNRLVLPLSDANYVRAMGALACGLLSACLAAIYLAARAGFGVSGYAVAGVLGLAWCVVAIPLALHLFFQRDNDSLSWYQREGFLTLVVVIATAASGRWVLEADRNAAVALFVAGTVAFAWTIFACLRGRSKRFAFLVGAGVISYSVWVAGVEWANGYLSPLFIENLILKGGEEHVDTLFFASLGNMVNTYGVPSTGWDGVPYTAYHFGSAWLFAQWATLCDLSVLDFYQLGVPVVLIPLFIRSLLIFAAEVRETFFASMEHRPGPVIATSGFLIAAASIGFLPPSALNSAAVWDAGPFLSESYVLAVAMAMLVVSAVASVGTAWTVPGEWGFSGAPRKWALVVFLLVFGPAAIGAIGLVKISIMLLLLALALFLFLRLKLYKVSLFLMSSVVLGIVSLGVYTAVVWSGLNEGLTFLSFLRAVVVLTWWPAFLIIHLFWTWLYAYLRLKAESARTFADVRDLISRRSIIDVELAVVLGLVGLLPGMFFNLRGDAYYFSDFQRWFAVSMLLANPLLLWPLWAGRTWSLAAVFRVRSIRTMEINQFVVGVVAVCLVATMALTTASWGGRLIRRNFDARRELQAAAGTRPVNSLRNEILHLAGHPGKWMNGGPQAIAQTQLRPLVDNQAFARALQIQKRYSVVNALLVIGELPVSERRTSLLHIDPRLDLYWNFHPRSGWCQFSAMVGPALSGMALVDGVPAGCDLGGFYGTEAYKEKAVTTTVLLPAAICDRARGLGFHRVIELAPGASSKVEVTRFDCDVRQ